MSRSKTPVRPLPVTGPATKAEVAAWFAVSTDTVDRYVASGVLPPPALFGASVRWDAGAVRRAWERATKSI